MFKVGAIVHSWNRSKEGVIVKDYGNGKFFIRWENGCQNPASEDELRIPGKYEFNRS